MMDKKLTCIAFARRAIPLLVCLLVLPLAAAPAQAEAGAEIGEVTRVVGTASAVRGDASWPVNAGSSVQAGDALQTGPKSRLAVVFDDGTRLMLGADSRITLDRYVYDPDAREGGAAMNVVSGVFRLISGALSKSNPDGLSVKTPLATLGIRGTDFWGEVSADHTGILLLDDGIVEITSAEGRSVLNEPGNGVDVYQGEAPTPPKSWGAPRVAAAKRSVSWQVD